VNEITFKEGVEFVLDSLLNDRLALLCGAGLSMAPPSSLPSAAALAARAKRLYDAQYGLARDPLPADVEEQAEFFFRRGELATVYFRRLIDPNAFAGQPNPGHHAVADLLLVRGIQTAVTTNVDTLIETAGQLLLGHVGIGIDGNGVAALSPDIAPLLKIHGCRTCDPDNMVWAPGQLEVEPVSGRILSSEGWLRVRLLDRDLLIVGYWTDWDYLNNVLERTLGAIRPARVIVVDPADAGNFAAKARALYALGQRATTAFQHVSASGSDFLERLRLEFSKSFMRRVLHAGANAYQEQTGTPPLPPWTEPADLDNEMLWRVRRDLEGCTPDQPALDRNPPEEALLGLTLLQLRAGGAVADGSYWRLNGRRIRVLRAVNQPLHRVKAAFERETAPTIAPEIIIAVGAEAQMVPSDILRGETSPTIARGDVSQWMTRSEAVQELGL
jgi:hypothetical protein